jgi:hypothetical protein
MIDMNVTLRVVIGARTAAFPNRTFADEKRLDARRGECGSELTSLLE